MGLPYICDLQTLKLDLGDPAQEGKRKNIVACNMRLYQTLGLTIGPDFTYMVPMATQEVPYSVPPSARDR